MRSSPLYSSLGYFCMIGLLRMHVLHGDYGSALAAVAEIDLRRKGSDSVHGLYARVTSCNITLHYYLGWCYLMLRRYPDAIRTFSTILFYIARTKQYYTRSYLYDQLVKKNEQM